MLCSVRCDELGGDPTVLADIDIDRPVPGRQGQSMVGDRYLGTCWARPVGANQLVAASALVFGPNKASLDPHSLRAFFAQDQFTPTPGPCQPESVTSGNPGMAK